MFYSMLYEVLKIILFLRLINLLDKEKTMKKNISKIVKKNRKNGKKQLHYVTIELIRYINKTCDLKHELNELCTAFDEMQTQYILSVDVYEQKIKELKEQLQ